MPSGDYAAVGGGALKIKGAKVQKKKKKRDKSSVEKTLNEDERSVAKKDDNKEDTDGRTEEDSHQDRKTESEKRYEEVRRKRLLEMAESSSSNPELLRTHKERVEQLNTYLSKLSEHHDMPKIGPG